MTVFFRLSKIIMAINYSKPPLTIEEQLKKFIKRGLIVSDEVNATKTLSSIGYYRLSGYLHPLRERDAKGLVLDKFVDNSNWNTALTLYEFDRKLRLLVLDALERVEVAIRCQLVYHFSHSYGPFGYTKSINFHEAFNHEFWLTGITKETNRSSEAFIKHYQSKYEGYPELPLWMLAEVLSLGSLSYAYGGLKNDDKKVISSYFNVHHKSLSDWLHSLSYIRNVCAHHSRLWNRKLSIRIEAIKNPPWTPAIKPRNDRIFCIILILKHLLVATGNNKEWVVNLRDLIRPIAKDDRWRNAMGLPSDWETYLQ